MSGPCVVNSVPAKCTKTYVDGDSEGKTPRTIKKRACKIRVFETVGVRSSWLPSFARLVCTQRSHVAHTVQASSA